jgi:uncharacterized protein (TIGR03435 family)
MSRAAACFFTILVLAVAASAQSGNPPAFEVADVHPSPHKPNPSMTAFVQSGRFQVRTATMLDLISNAYGIEADKVLGGPAWLDSDRFDITAKAAVSTSNETARLMLRSLLAERFKLVIRNEDRPVDVYALTVATGGPKMKQVVTDKPSGCERKIVPPPGPNAPGIIAFNCQITMAGLADGIRDMAGAAYINNAVIDQTGLAGVWEFELRWTPRGQLALAGSDGVSVIAAVAKLGLKLDLVKKPLPVIVVESVNRQPAANSPDLAKSLPSGLSEFEVADIKPSAPGTNQQRGNFQPGGRIDLQGFTMKNLVTIAWDIPDSMLAPVPKWFETDRFDVVARAPQETGASGPGADPETLRLMLRTLLVDRFRLATHMEEQPVSVYVLSLPKPQHKLKKADPSVRSGCKPGTEGPDARLGAGRTCQNTTMGELADKLQSFAPAYIDRPVVDATGLEGGWDFSFAWTGRNALEMARAQAGPPGAGPASAAPDGGLTLFEAVDKQLGLKLELQKRPMPVLVIDHAEQKPSEN